ncbi:alpha/beta fold hydrolase [Erythrobacter oryzae]|uniref:alpha/beta fold hydrolase n=1 Tax=Erythrobacter oryzae TaxID=3019556 RepID=UPI002554411F|nr:alpha/beta fold hydrolase [Erythrobacter sp. COR-2]
MAQGAAPARLFETFGPPDAPAVVLCHGLGLDAANMLELAHALARQRRVLVWNMPGHGGTPPAEDYAPAAMAQRCLAAMDAAGIEAADLVGFSFGGLVAQWLAASAPERVLSLVAYGCFAPFHQPAPVGPVQRAALLAAWRLLPWQRLCRQFAQACAATPQGQAEVLRALGGTTKPVFLAISDALFQSFVPRPEQRFAMPLMLLRGDKDANAPGLDAGWAGLMRQHPHAIRQIIAGAGHCAHNDQPDATATALRAFLDAVSPGSN